MGDHEGVGVDGVGRRQAPDLVVAVTVEVLVGEVAVQLGAIAVEVEVQRLVGLQRDGVVQVDVLLLQYVLDVGSVQRGVEVIGEGVLAAEHVDALQAAAVAPFGALAGFRGEATGVQLQALDLLGGDQGAAVAFREQARVVVAEHRQAGHLVAVLEHGVGDAELHRRAALGQIVRRGAAVALLEEVDTGGAATTLAAVQAYRVQAERVDTDAHRPLGEAGGEGGSGGLAPFGLVLPAMFVVTADVAIAEEQIEVAVLDKPLCCFLVIGHRLACSRDAQCQQANPFLQHLIVPGCWLDVR